MVSLTIIFNAKSMTYGIPSKTAASAPADDIAMRSPLSCLLGEPTSAERDRQRIDAIATLNLLSLKTIPVFDEATQTAARLLAMPISILSVMESKTQRFKSVVGLSSLGLMNPLAATRTLSRAESFCTHVIDSGKPFALEDTTTHPAFSSSLLVQQYGIQSYLGVPLITSEGCCIGTLAVMDLLPHSFTQQEIAFLELTARWAMSEFESQRMLSVISSGSHLTQPSKNSSHSISPVLSKIDQIRFDLVVQLTQDLRNPLTSITGMANMLSREIYGPLSAKQQEYANIVLSSSQQLLSMVNEIVEVGDLKADNYQLDLSQVDIEMVGQQAIAALESLTKQQELEVRLTVEPSSHLWTLDKRVVKQMIYHLVFSVVKMSTAGSTIRIHISRKDDSLNLSLWVSNPWLGEDLPQALINWEENSLSQSIPKKPTSNVAPSTDYERIEHTATLTHPDSDEVFAALATAQRVDASRQELGLLLSRHLTKMHGGEALIQGSAANGHRYIISLPAS